MAAVDNVQKKKAQPSRKGKKAWRKNVDITDVEEGQEDLRAIERIVGHTGERKDDELFTIDTTGDNQVSRRLAKDRPLRIHEILDQRSAVPAVKSKNPFKKPDMTDRLESKHENKFMDKMVKRKNDSAPMNDKKAKKTKATKSYDLWDEVPCATETKDEPMSDFLPVKAKVKAPKTLASKPKALDYISAVDTPEGGHSYNPSVEEHQKLLAKAVEIEERKAKTLKDLQEQLSYREELKQLIGESATSHINTEGKLEMKDNEEEEEEEEEQDQAEDDGVSKKKKAAERKTRQQRQKNFRLATEGLIKKQKDQDKVIRQHIDKLYHIEKELEDKAKELEEIALKRGEKKEMNEMKGLKKLGKYRVPELAIDVQLTDELCETLRQLKPEGNIFRDRFLSMQKRNIIETRVPVSKSRRYKLKEYEARSYKNFDQQEAIKRQRGLL